MKRNRQVRDYRLRRLRFRKLLENCQLLLRLVQDGDEKQTGDYIFDRQYVHSLVDSMTQQLGDVVFDAQVLQPRGSEQLYRDYDRCWERARELLAQPDDGGSGDPAAALEEFDEYRLLKRINEGWVHGDPGASTIDLMRRAMDHAVTALAPPSLRSTEARQLHIRGTEARQVMDLLELDPPVAAGESGPCWPLEQLLPGNAGAAAATAADADGDLRWFAATTRHELSIQSTGPGRAVVLECSLQAHPPSDYVFLYLQGAEDHSAFNVDGLMQDRTQQGRIAWQGGGADLTRTLQQLGRRLFGLPG